MPFPKAQTTTAHRESLDLESLTIAEILLYAADEIQEHNNEYKHSTRQEFIELLRKRAEELK